MKTLRISFLYLFTLLLGSSLLPGCQSKTNHEPVKIAISSATPNYINWIHHADSTIEVVDMKTLPIDSAILMLATCNGIIFTGGEDVVPIRYEKDYDSARCETNPHRDTLEFALYQEAVKLQLPIIGICRGQQLINVANGGTLVVDIPTDHPGNVSHQCEDYLKCYHSVSIIKNSLLHEISKADTGLVASNHHQAIDKPGSGLRIVAWAVDSIPEATERADPKDKPFFLTVQWHPERMDATSPLSMPLIRAFLEASAKVKLK